MLLGRLLERIGYSRTFKEKEISFITDNSENVTNNSLFVCIEGKEKDGHAFAGEAAEKGAAVICEKSVGVKGEIIVSDTRKAYAALCSEFFGSPAEKLRLIGITGTNGKTTTAFLIKDILEKSGDKWGLVGTVCDMAGDSVFSGERTTPDPFELNCLFAKMVDRGCKGCVMEVSSQALVQGRVDSLFFDCAVFTNISDDHLDYHKTMANYMAAKKKLFSMCRVAVINADDKNSSYMTKNEKCRVVTYSAEKNTADYVAKNIRQKADSVEYEFLSAREIGRVRVGIPGMFSVYNSMAAAVCALEEGAPFSDVIESLALSQGVKGRAEVVPTNRDFTVIIDYAHTPDGLENILKTLKAFAKGRIITLFGCGGNRDKIKRPLMGETAARLSDYLIVTSDNPRRENPADIIVDILKGCEGAEIPVETIENRREAIEKALEIAEKNDIILLAGKGHETYQIFGSKKIHFDEREIVSEFLNSEVKE